MRSSGILLTIAVLVVGSLQIFAADEDRPEEATEKTDVQDLLSQLRFSVLREVAPKLYKDSITNYAVEEVGDKLFYIYRLNVHDIRGWRLRTKFRRLYNLYITEPCAKTTASNEKPDLEGDTKGKLFTDMAEMCDYIKEDDQFYEKSYKAFKHMDNQTPDFIYLDEARENHGRFKEGEMTY